MCGLWGVMHLFYFLNLCSRRRIYSRIYVPPGVHDYANIGYTGGEYGLAVLLAIVGTREFERI